MSAVILLIFVLGVIFLVRLGMGTSFNRVIPPPISSSSGAVPPTGDSSPTATGSTGTGGEPGKPAPQDDSGPTATSSTGTGGEPGKPAPQDDSGPTATGNTRTTNPDTLPPRPAVQLSSVGGVGPRAVLPSGNFALKVWFYVEQAFSVQVRVVDLNIIQEEKEYFIKNPAGEDATKCNRGTVEPGETEIPLCAVAVGATEADPNAHGILELVVRATCTAAIGRPCEKVPAPYVPSPNNPIDVTWSYHYEWGDPARPSVSRAPSSPTPPQSTRTHP